MKKVALLGMMDEIAVQFVKDNGYEMVFQGSSVQQLIARRPAIVLLNIISPDKETVRTVRQLRECSFIEKIIMATSMRCDRVEQFLYASGVFIILHRPYSLARLIEYMEAPVSTRRRQSINEFFLRLGIPPVSKGGDYLCAAVCYAIAHNDLSCGMYNDVAASFDVSAATVEKCIRDVITRIYEKGDMETLQQIFGYTAPGLKPTNLQFIGQVVRQLSIC